MLIPKNKPLRDKKHLAFIRTLPCVVTGRKRGVQAAHIRDGYFAMGSKPSDARSVPLLAEVHYLQHQIGEKAFWGDKSLDAVKWLSGLLYINTGNEEECCRLIAKFRNDFPRNK